MTIVNMNGNNENVSVNEKLYRQAINGGYPMDNTGNRLFNKAVDKSLIMFPSWQRTETSNPTKIAALAREFDINMMDPIILVAHPEENAFCCVNGFHRYTAWCEVLGNDTIMAVILLFNGSIEERTRFEIDLFLKQQKTTETLREIQMHDAKLEIKDPAAVAVDDACRKYNVAIVATKGNRPARVLGSYNTAYGIAKTCGKRLEDIFTVLDVAGYMESPNGLAAKIMNPVGNIIKAYPFTVVSLGEYMRTMEPNILMAKATAKYPERGWRVQLTLFLQDWVVDTYHVAPRFDCNGKVIKTA